MRRALVLLLLAACAGPVKWEREGASPAALEEDTKQCNQQARLKATSVGSLPPLPTPGMIGSPVRQENQSAMREMEEFQRCMLDKGYKKSS
jgi:hypothetical protein